MGMLGQMGDMYKLQKQAKAIQKELAKIHIFSEVDGVRVTVNGQQEVIPGGVEILDETILQNPVKLGKALAEAFNKALKKSQQVAAEKMKAVMGDLGSMMGK
ncbi:MAG TPA: YbaB/EbfC family nucleoid-associated protein [Candidatus Gracilibacteria bacterium]